MSSVDRKKKKNGKMVMVVVGRGGERGGKVPRRAGIKGRIEL